MRIRERPECKKCPQCGNELYREEIDIGVGLCYGPYHCNFCGWVEYDQNARTADDDDVSF